VTDPWTVGTGCWHCVLGPSRPLRLGGGSHLDAWSNVGVDSRNLGLGPLSAVDQIVLLMKARRASIACQARIGRVVRPVVPSSTASVSTVL